jgi:hypothetical protein
MLEAFNHYKRLRTTINVKQSFNLNLNLESSHICTVIRNKRWHPFYETTNKFQHEHIKQQGTIDRSLEQVNHVNLTDVEDHFEYGIPQTAIKQTR